MEWAPWTF